MGLESGRHMGLESGRHMGLESGRHMGLESGRHMGLPLREILIIFTIIGILGFGFSLRTPTIDYSIKKASTNSTFQYQNRNKEFSVSFLDKEKNGPPAVKFEAGGGSVGMAMILGDGQLAKVGKEEVVSKSAAVVGADPRVRPIPDPRVRPIPDPRVRPSVDTLVIADVLPSTDLTYQIIDNGVKEEIVLKSADAVVGADPRVRPIPDPRVRPSDDSDTPDPIYKFKIDAEGVVPEIIGYRDTSSPVIPVPPPLAGSRPKAGKTGIQAQGESGSQVKPGMTNVAQGEESEPIYSPVFVDEKTGEYAFHFLAPYMYDSAGARSDEVAMLIRAGVIANPAPGGINSARQSNEIVPPQRDPAEAVTSLRLAMTTNLSFRI